MEQSLLHKLETWGYYALPRPHESSPGHTGLLILLRHQPSGHHFDPQSIHIRLQNWDNIPHWTTLEAGTAFQQSRRVHPGKVTVQEIDGDKAEFFTFGGKLEAEALPREVIYSLRSSAPVLALTKERETAVDQLAAETQALFAKIEAHHGWREQTLLENALRYSPEQLYLSVLTSLWRQDEEAIILRQSHPALSHLLKGERAWFMDNGLWSDKQPTLAALFAA